MICDTFAPYANRPVVGVHIRRGDFMVLNQDAFDVHSSEWHAAPDWWFEHVMGRIQEAVPNVAFFVSCSGSLKDFPNICNKFDVFDLPGNAPVGLKTSGHVSRVHPAADLFALGCCQTLIGSSCSNFTHYAANMLGGASNLLIPPHYKIEASAPEFCLTNLHGKGAQDWLAACRQGEGVMRVFDLSSFDFGTGAKVEWMQPF